MTENTQRSGFLLFLDRALKLVDGLKGIIMILAALSVGGASGTLMAGGVSPDTVRAIADSTTKAQLAPLTQQIQDIQQENRAAFGALMDALPAFKKAVEDRGQANAEAVRKKAETDTLMTNLTEHNR